MEAPSFVRCGTRFQAVAAQGERSGALVFKEKLRRMIGQGCAVAASAEAPPEWLEDAVGSARDIYSGQASRWLMEAAAALLGARDLDWLYVSTTEVIPHKHAPTEARASEWVTALDEGIAALHEQATDIVITADHGMSGKRQSSRQTSTRSPSSGDGLSAAVRPAERAIRRDAARSRTTAREG
jgi:phosphonoacetate hydrolase